MSQMVSLGQVASPAIMLAQDSIKAPAAPVLPDDLVSHALSFLSPEDLARASGACREWNKLAGELWKDFDMKKICHVIDQNVWEKHVDLARFGLNASGAPAIDKRIAIPFIKRLSSQVEGDAGVTLLTMPKGLTLNKLITLAAAPKQGPATRFRFMWLRITEELGNVAVDKTHTVAITRSVIKDSRNNGVDAHIALVQSNGGELPEFLPAATLDFLTYISSPEEQPPTRLYGVEPWTFTRCLGNIDGASVFVGGFAAYGLDADYYLYDADFFGAGVARKF